MFALGEEGVSQGVFQTYSWVGKYPTLELHKKFEEHLQGNNIIFLHQFPFLLLYSAHDCFVLFDIFFITFFMYYL